VRSAFTRHLPGFGVLVLLVVAWSTLWFGVGWGGVDDGNYLHVAERLLDGQVLHRDVQDVHTGYINLWNAAVAGVFGRTLLALRWPLVAIDLVVAGLIYAVVAARTSPGRGALAALAIGLLSVPLVPNPTANWYALLCVVVAIAAAELAEDRPRVEVVLGAMLGLTFGFRQLSAVFFAAGLVAYLLHRPPRDQGSPRLATLSGLLALAVVGAVFARAEDAVGLLLYALPSLAVVAVATARTRWSDRAWGLVLLRLAAGFSLALAPLAAYHAWHGTVHEWLRDVVVVALSLPGLPFVARLEHLFLVAAPLVVLNQPEGATLTGLVASSFFPILALSPWLAAVPTLRRMLAGAAPGALPILAVCFAPVSLHYATPMYLYYAAPLSLCALLLLAYTRRSHRRWTAALAIVAIGLGATFFGGRSAWGLLVDTLRGAPQHQRLVDLPAARVWIPAEEADAYEHMVAVIHRYAGPDDAILAMPNQATLYVLAERRNPTRFFNSALGLYDPLDRARAEADVASDPPKLVLWNPDDKYVTPPATAFIARLLPAYDRVGVDAQLGLEMWVRRREAESLAP